MSGNEKKGKENHCQKLDVGVTNAYFMKDHHQVPIFTYQIKTSQKKEKNKNKNRA